MTNTVSKVPKPKQRQSRSACLASRTAEKLQDSGCYACDHCALVTCLLGLPFLPFLIVPGQHFSTDCLKKSNRLPAFSAQLHLTHQLQGETFHSFDAQCLAVVCTLATASATEPHQTQTQTSLCISVHLCNELDREQPPIVAANSHNPKRIRLGNTLTTGLVSSLDQVVFGPICDNLYKGELA